MLFRVSSFESQMKSKSELIEVQGIFFAVLMYFATL